jgi:hypothetical protein
MTRSRTLVVCLLGALFVPAGAMAQSSGASSSDAGALRGTGGAAEGEAAAGGDAAAGGEAATTVQDPDLALVEERDQPYFLLGVGAHAVFVPDFLIQAFGLDMFETVFGWAIGPEFTYRKDGLDIVLSAWWASYPVDTPSRETGDPATETEIIKSTLGLVWFTADFMASYDLEPWVALVYGGGFGIGITTGKVTRTEAYPVGDGWQACDGPELPDATYCEASGGHYGPVPKKAAGVWPIYPILRAKIGPRFKPLRNLVITPEFGVGIPELFTLGLRVNYMF